MTDHELRALVRDAVSRHFTASGGPSLGPATPAPSRESTSAEPHASHAMYLTVVNVGDACVIEPGVTCNHCGYCKSHGH